jgi:battenin
VGVTRVCSLLRLQHIIENSGYVSIVLLAADMPALVAQTVAPFFLSRVRYAVKVPLAAVLAVTSYLTVALASGVGWKLVGVMITSVCFGLGEASFLGLASNLTRVEANVISAYGSGTGGAGLAGAGLYLLLTDVLGWSPKSSLLALSALPLVLLYAFFGLVAPSMLSKAPGLEHGTGAASRGVEATPASLTPGQKLQYLPQLLPFFLPLLSIYILTFSINHAMLPYVKFSGRQHYVLYFFLYQTGVFLSRSSLSLVRLRSLWLPVVLQSFNFLVFFAHLTGVSSIPSFFVALAMVFFMGCIAGATYVNTFDKVSKQVDFDYREFAMGIVSTATTSGPIIAGTLGVFMERFFQRAAALESSRVA